MHSDYLNEDKICQMFHEDQDSGHKKQQISLNFTVTSRESRCAPHTGTEAPKSLVQYAHNIHSQMQMNKNALPCPSSSNDSINLALSELDKFNTWMHSLNKNNQKLLDDFSTLTTYAENNRSVLLTMPDLGSLRKRYSKSVKNIIDKNVYASEISMKECQQCKKYEDLIEVIQEQYKIKVEECGIYCQKMEKFQQELSKQIERGLKASLMESVQLNLIKQQNEGLNSQIVNLKIELDKSKLQKSSLMQKSTQFLRTKQLLQKRLQSGCTNSKLFSNAKYSTNTLNPNDTMNRVESIICFGESELNLQDLIRFYGEEVQNMKKKIREITIEEEKKKNIKFTQEARSAFQKQLTEAKLYNLYREIQKKMMQVKSLKQKNSSLVTSRINERRQELELQNSRQTHENQDLKKFITTLEKQIKGLENEKNNLTETNLDLLRQYETASKKIKQMEQIMTKMKVQFRQIYEAWCQQNAQRKQLQYHIEEIKGSIRVYCRVRPRMGMELKHKSAIVYAEDNKIIKQGKEYEFDNVFGEKCSQQNIYKEVEPLVQYAYNQKSLCIFAYGQTGSGKTFTMHGDQKNPGLAPNIINHLYQLILKDKKTCRQYDISLSMTIVQIYKEQIRDLLGIGGKLEIKESVSEGVYIEGCMPIRFKNKEQMLQVYQSGVKNRTSCQTDMNTDSSRSHFIVTILIERIQKKMKEEGGRASKVTKISLIDLAGAQKLTSSNPLIAKQTQFINKSLSSLVSVLSALKNKSDHIPYRDSKLTYMLKQFLSSKCNILTFVNISASQINSTQTTNSLMFGVRARAIQRNTYSKSKDAKQNKEIKEVEKNRRSSARLSIS